MELTYFDFPGRAEVIRILLHSAGADFKDNRFPFSDWPSIKPKTPLGQVPVLNIDGTDHCQSIALGRYAAKLAGMYPADPIKAMVADEVIETLNELLSKTPQGGTEEEKKAKRKEFQDNEMTKYFSFVESRIQKFGDGKTVCGEPSYADLFVMAFLQGIESGGWDYIDPEFPESYPGIMACAKAAREDEKVQGYYASTK